MPLSGRNVGRERWLSIQVVERGLLPRHVAVGRAEHDLGDGRAAGPDALGQGQRDGGRHLLAALGHAHGDPAGPAGRGHQLGAVEHQVRGPEEQQLVLVAGRFALHGVDDDGPAAAGGVGHGELDGGREARPAPARQPGRLERGDERLAPGPPGRGRERHGAQAGHVAGQVGGVTEEVVGRRRRESFVHARSHRSLPCHVG